MVEGERESLPEQRVPAFNLVVRTQGRCAIVGHIRLRDRRKVCSPADPVSLNNPLVILAPSKLAPCPGSSRLAQRGSAANFPPVGPVPRLVRRSRRRCQSEAQSLEDQYSRLPAPADPRASDVGLLLRALADANRQAILDAVLAEDDKGAKGEARNGRLLGAIDGDIGTRSQEYPYCLNWVTPAMSYPDILNLICSLCNTGRPVGSVACHASYPWVSKMVTVLREHPNVYAELGGSAPRYVCEANTGWEAKFQFTNALLS